MTQKGQHPLSKEYIYIHTYIYTLFDLSAIPEVRGTGLFGDPITLYPKLKKPGLRKLSLSDLRVEQVAELRRRTMGASEGYRVEGPYYKTHYKRPPHP